jgi:Beta protein
MSLDHSHYVPILKAKGGEFWALQNLKKSTRTLITPVLELVRFDPKRHTFDSDLEKKIDSLFESWGNAPLYFDVTHSVPKNSLPEAKSITAAFIQLRKHEMEAIPVTRLGYSPKFQEAVRKIIETDDAGLMVRLGADDLAVKDKLTLALSNLRTFFGLQESEIDLMLDYGYRRPDEYEDLIQRQRLHLAKIPNIHKWRSLMIASASFPGSIKGLPHAEWVHLDRTEWKAWEGVAFADTTTRIPSYSDYGAKNPAPPGFGTPKPNLRYTLEERYLCRRDDAKHVAMKAICKSLIKRSEYKGEEFSAGDKAISVTAANQSSRGSGGGQQWTQWSANHHIEFVATQIQNLPAS